MRDSLRCPLEAVVVSGTWPIETTGYGIAVASALREYGRFFSRVHFFGPAGEPIPDAAWSQDAPVHWIPLRLSRAPKWWRFLRSIGIGRPAVAVRFHVATSQFLHQINDLVRQARARNALVVVIYEDVPAACYLPYLQRQHPAVVQVVRSHNCLVKGFAGLDAHRSIVSKLAWGLELARIRRFEQATYASADAFWAITSQDASEYRTRLGIEPQGVLGISLDTDRYHHVPSGDQTTIVHVGSADLRKGAGLRLFLHEAWHKVRAQVPQARLLLGGRGTDRLANPVLGVEGLGYVHDDRDVLARGRIFINPQQIGAGVKIKSITAMLAGKALVSTTTGIEGVEGTNGQHFFVADTPEALAARIVALIQSPSQTEAVAREARALAAIAYHKSTLFTAVQPLLEALLRSTETNAISKGRPMGHPTRSATIRRTKREPSC